MAENTELTRENEQVLSEEDKKNKKKNKKNKKKKKRSCLGAIFSFFFKLVLICFILGLVGCGVLAYKYGPVLMLYNSQAKAMVADSTVETFKPNMTSYIHDKDGKILARLKRDGDTTYLPYDQIPEAVVNSFVAVEDNTFWENPGFDYRGIARVLYRFVKTKGQEKHGASTVTQQLARNIFLTQEKSLERKAKELLISYYLTQKYTKKQIMEFYVNNIYFANGFYGIEAAAKGYFGVSSKELSLSQCAYLCSIPNRPSYYDPFLDVNNALNRRNKILEDMAEMGMISESDVKFAEAEKIRVKRTSYETHNYETTYAIDCAVRALMEKNGFEFQYHFKKDEDYETYDVAYEQFYDEMKTELYTGGYHVYTSLDENMQAVLQDAVDDQLSFDTETDAEGIYAFQGAATCVDNASGKVVAIVGGRSQEETGGYSLNRAYQSRRQPGSTIKPLVVYTPALECYYAPSTQLMDISIQEANKPGTDVKELKGPKYSLRKAVELSKNGCAYQLFNDIGVSFGLSYIEAMQFATIAPSDRTLSSSLGGLTYGTTTTEMAGAYATLADYGTYRDTTCITSIVNPEGEEQYSPREYTVYDAEASRTMLDILAGVMTEGTGKVLNWDLPTEAVGKTGTTNDSKDGWFCGATPYYTIAVWCGYDIPRTLDSLYGGSYPGHIWKAAMETYVTNLGTATFDDPEIIDPGEILPGRRDSEYLSRGYTVGDYRADYSLKEQVKRIANKMYTIDPSSKKFDKKIEDMYKLAEEMIGQIYGTKLGNEAKAALALAYGEVTSETYVWKGNETKTEEETESEISVEINLDGIEQEEYMPGRKDSEVLSPRYTVGDYRSDKKLESQVVLIAEQIKGLDMTVDHFEKILEAYYEKGLTITNTIYGDKIGKAALSALNEAYNDMKEAYEKSKGE